VVKLRHLLHHPPPFIKIAKKYYYHSLSQVLLFSLFKKIQCRRGLGYAKICEEIKRGKCPEPKKKESKRVR